MVDPCFQFGIFIDLQTGEDGVLPVGEDIDSGVFFDNMKQGGNNIVWELPIVNELSALAVGDACSIEGEHVSAVVGKPQLPGEGQDSYGRPAACQNDLFSLLLYLNQRL